MSKKRWGSGDEESTRFDIFTEIWKIYLVNYTHEQKKLFQPNLSILTL